MESKKADTKKARTADEIIEDIYQFEKQHSGIDWKEAVKNKVDYIKAMDKSYDRLEMLKSNMDEAEIQSGINAGLLNEQGNIKRTYYSIGERDTNAMSSPVANSDVLTTKPDDSHPVLAFLNSRAETYKNDSGDDIKSDVVDLIHTVHSWANIKDQRKLANALITASCLGVGALIKVVVQAIRAETEEISIELLIEIMGDCIVSMGFNVVTGILGVLAILSVPFLFVSAQKEKGTMLIINATTDKLALVDKSVVHGKIISTFRSSPDELATTSEQLIPGSVNLNQKDYVGIYYGLICFSKREAAWYGTEGALKFEATKNRRHGAWIGWEVPISGDNRVWVSINHEGSIGDITDDVDDSGKQEDISTRGNQTLTGRVNSSSGGDAYFLCYFSEN